MPLCVHVCECALCALSRRREHGSGLRWGHGILLNDMDMTLVTYMGFFHLHVIDGDLVRAVEASNHATWDDVSISNTSGTTKLMTAHLTTS